MNWYKDIKEFSQNKRAENREKSTNILIDYNINFESKNEGAHLIVKGSELIIDFWPGTGKYIVRGGEEGRGVFSLLKLLGINIHKKKRENT